MTSRKLALVMGVANQRSIAWACVQSFLNHNYDCILTYQSARFEKSVHKLIEQQEKNNNELSGRILGAVPCNVECETAIPLLLQSDIPSLFTNQHHRLFDAIVHSIAYADMQDPRLSQATWSAFSQALHISTYSFLQLIKELVEKDYVHTVNTAGNHSSLIALTYLGAVRAVPNYQSMGPAKAALEATVRGLALEYGPTHQLHINAVSAGPISTAAAKGGIRNFSALQQAVKETSPLRRHVKAEEVANVIRWLSESTGITGQTIYVDAGYNSVVPIAL